MNKNIKKFPCKNCGAPVTTDICPYCKANSGINQNLVDLEYPVLNYETMEKGNLSIVIIVLLVVMLFFLFPLTFIFDENKIFKFAGLFFAIVELIVFMPIISKILSFIIKYHMTEKYGDELIATVQGYMNDKHNVFNYKTLKLLVDTPEEKGYILYRLNTQNKTYKIGSRIKLKVRKNACVIANDTKYYFE